jgi:hypothetical protein
MASSSRATRRPEIKVSTTSAKHSLNMVDRNRVIWKDPDAHQ